MVRRFNNSVHKQVSRLMRGGFPMKEPAWYQAVLDHPPLPLPARAPPKRTAFDSHWSSFHENPHQRRPLPVYYMEDRVRKQFFTDHPFETFRPRTLVEDERVDEDHPVQGEAWTRLRERGRNPSPEDAIQFAVTLYKHHGVSLSNAYQTAVAQFRALRAEHHLMTAYAAQEAEAQGAIFGPTPVTAGFEAENAVMAQNVEIKARADQSDIIARKRWRMVVPPGGPQGEWSRGQEYVQLWRSGVRPNYEALITPLDADPLAALEQQKAQIDRLSMQPA